MISIWERESFLVYDVIIVGAGITGLSTAISLKESNPGLSVLVLERGTLPTGASTKNAGFACFGSLTELLYDLETLGADNMLALVEKRWNGLMKTRKRLGDGTIDLQVKGGYELLDAGNRGQLGRLDELNKLLRPLFKTDVFLRADNRLDLFGFKEVSHLIYNPLEGQLHSGKLLKALWRLATHLQVDLLTGTEVTGFEETNAGVEVKTESLRFQCKALALCTNAFTRSLLPDIELKPGRGMVMLLNPVKPLRFEGTFHYQEGFYYFRDYYGKLVFGGGRNLDFEGETTTEFGLNPNIEAELHRLLKEVILPENPYQTELKWSGIMAFGSTRHPIVQQVSEGVFAGVRLGGMGVAIGSMVGEELAQLILKRAL